MSTSPAATVEVQLGRRSYPIRVGSGLLGASASYEGLPRGSSAVIVSNTTVAAIYGRALAGALEALYPRVDTVLVADGEAFKTWETMQSIVDGLVAAHADRSSTVFALGGGVVGDLAGFASACYMRGIGYVQVPTTLLAQVDSSVGGKTGINHAAGKNLVGAFHQPLAVIADVDVLATLPRRELVAGLAEVIKYGVIADDAFLAWVEASLPALLAGDRAALVQAVTRSCEIKASVVAADEREAGPRAVLNFGHTFAHAIETGTGHGTWLRGEAVGCGMAMAADLSTRLGLIAPSHAKRIQTVIGAAGLPLRAPDLELERWLDLMRMDKKAAAGALRFVVVEGPGRARLRTVDAATVAATIEAFAGAEGSSRTS